MHDNEHKNENGAMKIKEVGELILSFHFCSQTKDCFPGKVHVCQLHLCPYRFDPEDERPDDEISSFFLLL